MVTVTSSTLQKHAMYLREGTEPHGNKPQYEGSEIPHTENSHGEKHIQVYGDTK